MLYGSPGLAMNDDLGERLRCVQLQVGHGGRAILPPIDLAMRRGELWAVVGRNGTGKTTWLRTLLGLIAPVAGSLQRRAGLRVSYAAQHVRFDPLFPALCRDVVAMAADRAWSFARPRLFEPRAVRPALERAGAWALADRPFRALSEGQQQRVLLARMIASQPELALLDEPTSAMDAVAEREALAVLDELRKERGTTVVMVSHYLGLVRELADRVLLLDGSAGAVVIGTPHEVLDHEAFRRNYAHSGDDSRRV
jgi:zinc transport system ATP-binding protein